MWSDFCEFYDEVGSVKGMRWDDVVVKFEWITAINSIQ